MSEEEELSGEEKLKGLLHDTISDLLYEQLPRHVREALNKGFEDERRAAVDEAHEEALAAVEQKVEDLEMFVDDLPDKPLCSNCGGSGGGRGPHKCRSCGGSGYA